MNIFSIINIVMTLFTIYIIYLIWDYFFNGGWMRSIPGYSLINGIIGNNQNNNENQSGSWWPF